MPLKRLKTVAEEVEEEIKKPSKKEPISFVNSGNLQNGVLSTGSTLLDLNISGGRVRGGGIPGGIMLEIFGPSGAGKTAILAEIAASAQSKGNQVKFLDPEARLDQEYSRIYGMNLSEENYHRPNTVREMFKHIWDWKDIGYGLNVICADSLAALSTEIEMDDQDKMGMKRAKDFSEGLRKTCRIIAQNNSVLACSNQIRESPTGQKAPGGQALTFYASLIIKIAPLFQGSKIIKKIKNAAGVEIEKIVGMHSEATIKKSSIDDPYRECNVSIIFGYGIDDIRDQLEYYKAMTKETTFNAIDKGFRSMDQAIEFIEQNNLTDKLKERTIGIWEEIEQRFKIDRKRKVR